MPGAVRTHKDLDVYKKALEAAMAVFELSKGFPREEVHSLTDQIRRSARSVCANLAEAWRKRCYPAAFKAKLVDCEAEAAETQVWLEFAARCHYAELQQTAALSETYDAIIGTLVGMRTHSSTWTIGEQGPPSSPRMR
jgi:four helix bundle protein